MPARRGSRKTRRSRRPPSSKRSSFSRNRSFKRSRRSGERDVHHFKQLVDGGTITLPNPTSGNIREVTGACIMRLTDLPIYDQMAPNFEFARLNKCKIEFIPKYNMQMNQLTTGSGAVSTGSITGTMITAVDQIPIYTGATAGSVFVTATSWNNDGDELGSATYASFVQTSMTPNYVRSLQGAKEKELYKKQTISFYPAFYDYVMTPSGNTAPGQPAVTSISAPIPTVAAVAVTTNGCVERKIKKWISINNVTSGNVTALGINAGPLYYGPVYALDVNVPGSTGFVPLFDVRLTYSVSFKRYKGTV